MNREQGVTWFWLKRGICSPEGTSKRSQGCVGVFRSDKVCGFSCSEARSWFARPPLGLCLFGAGGQVGICWLTFPAASGSSSRPRCAEPAARLPLALRISDVERAGDDEGGRKQDLCKTEKKKEKKKGFGASEARLAGMGLGDPR